MSDPITLSSIRYPFHSLSLSVAARVSTESARWSCSLVVAVSIAIRKPVAPALEQFGLDDLPRHQRVGLQESSAALAVGCFLAGRDPGQRVRRRRALAAIDVDYGVH